MWSEAQRRRRVRSPKAPNASNTVADGSGSLVSFQQRGITQAVRASVHYFNTDQEIDYFLDSLKKVLATG